MQRGTRKPAGGGRKAIAATVPAIGVGPAAFRTARPEPGRTGYPIRTGSTRGAPRLTAQAMKRILLVLLRIYKIALSPYLGSRCRFMPSCSEYARDAVVMYGAGRGSWMAVCRLCRCHPFAQGGYDPVPEPRNMGSATQAPRASAAPGHTPVTIRLPRP